MDNSIFKNTIPIDPELLSALDVLKAGKVITAEKWTTLWTLVFNKLNSVGMLGVKLEDIHNTWALAKKELDLKLQSFDTLYNGLKNSFVHYGADTPTNPYIKFWVQPLPLGTPVPWVTYDVLNAAVSKALQDFTIPTDLAGKKTDTGGEVFNDYENNKALTQYATAIGKNNTAGTKAFTITGWDKNTKTYILNSVDGLSTGDKISIEWKESYSNCAAITGVDATKNRVTVDNFITGSDESAGIEKLLFIPEKPWLGTISYGYGSSAEGAENIALLPCAHAEGRGNKSLGFYSHTEGRKTVAHYAAHAEGYSTEATGDKSHAEGVSTQATGHHSHAEGNLTVASGDTSHAEGLQTKAEGAYSHAEGANTLTYGKHSHSEGNTTKTGYIDNNGEVVGGDSAHAEGEGTKAEGNHSHAEGYFTEAKGVRSHAEGQYTKAYGDYSHSEGNTTKTGYIDNNGKVVRGNSAHAEGIYTTASGEGSHAEGKGTQSTGRSSHAEGYNTNAIGEMSHAEGGSTTAEGNLSHAEGNKTHAKGDYSHAEGEDCKAGKISHAEGYKCKAGKEDLSTWVAHAEGHTTEATGDYSHSEGKETKASGECTHAEGYLTEASGKYSHAGGIGTRATYVAQTVIGKYNANKADTLFEIGNGTYEKQTNAFEVKTNGAIVIGGVTLTPEKLTKLLALIQ